jgi:hypothetical protein
VVLLTNLQVFLAFCFEFRIDFVGMLVELMAVVSKKQRSMNSVDLYFHNVSGLYEVHRTSYIEGPHYGGVVFRKRSDVTNDIYYWCELLREVCDTAVAASRGGVGQAIGTPSSVGKMGP